jgi:hypothetical protein
MSVPRITEHYRDAVAKTSVKTRHDNQELGFVSGMAGRLVFRGQRPKNGDGAGAPSEVVSSNVGVLEIKV